MRYLFKTRYEQDLRVRRHGGDLFWYGLLAAIMLVLPMLAGEFYVGELAGVFVFAIAGVGLMLLIGYTGLVMPPSSASGPIPTRCCWPRAYRSR